MYDIYDGAQKHRAYAAALRRYFHMHPELSGSEYHTQQKIIEELAKLGLTGRPAGGTGVIAELKGALPGKTIAIRADIDALPIGDECGKDYQSQNYGVCHACGHDGHMAVLFGAIRILVDLQDNLAGTFRLIFQPNEEQFPSGALAMIADGALTQVDTVIGAHIWQPLTLGTIGISYGNLMAAPDKFTITIQGTGGHGSMPHQTNDPILLAAQIILALNTIVSRDVNPLDLAVLSIGSVHTGNAFNIIPNAATIEGTVRTFSKKVRRLIFTRIEEITRGICQANHASCEIVPLFGHPALVNSPNAARIIAQAAANCRAGCSVDEIPPVMCGEDFSYYLEIVPGAFFFIGTGTDVLTYPHHHPKFDLDERCIVHGMEVMTRAAIALAKE